MKYNKVLLVSPGFQKGRHRLSIHPLAGIGYIAQSLKDIGICVNVFDMNLQYKKNDLQLKVAEFKPDIIGFTMMTFGHRDQYEMINSIKSLYPNIEIVAGGAHVSTLKEKVLRDCPAIDYGIILEGDLSIVKLCQGEKLNNIPGIIYRCDGKIVMNNFADFIMDLDSLTFPKYESFELDKYPTKQIGIVTSRGCPYSCIYCPVIAAIGKKFRQRSAQNVVNEIEYWYDKGYKEILILDDNFTLSRKRVEEICTLLGKKNFKDISLKCPNGIRADKVDYEILKSMREVGFDMLAFGVEAGEDRILKNIKKGENLATIEKSLQDACRLGFDVDLFFLIGSPGERLCDIESSFSLATRYPIRSAKFYNIIAFPETELFNWIQEKGYFLYPLDYILNNTSHFINEPCFFTPEMPVPDRKKAFKVGQRVSRKIHRNYIERKIKGPLFIRKIISIFYTSLYIEQIVNNNKLFIRLKQKIKNLVLS